MVLQVISTGERSNSLYYLIWVVLRICFQDDCHACHPIDDWSSIDTEVLLEYDMIYFIV